MAKIKFGLVVTDARGKLGGHVFSKNRSGAYLRTKVVPVNPQTTFQTNVRALFGSISQQWSSLTEDVRNAFREAVTAWSRTDIFGDIKNPTGKALYQRLNNQAQLAGYPAVSAVSLPTEVPSAIFQTASLQVLNEEIVLGMSALPTGSRIMIFGTQPLSQGTKFVKDKLRLLLTELATANDSVQLWDNYIAKFGIPATGSNVYFAVKYVNPQGNATVLQTLKATVA